MNRKQIALSVCVFFLAVSPVLAQEDADQRISAMEARVKALEEYVEKLNTNLETFSKELLNQIDIKVKSGNDKVVAINPVSKTFTKVETNSGMFLIAVNKFQRMEEGYRLLLNIGNPNAAQYSGMRFKLHWGKKWDADSIIKYEDWRASLMNGEYTYGGELSPGEWSEVTIDLTPAGANQLEYIELEMEVDSVQLQK